MKPRTKKVFAAMLLVTGIAGIACGQNDEPDAAKQLYAKVNEGAGFKSWRRAPGWPERRTSVTAHSDEVDIYVNKEIEVAFAGPTAITSWPVGSIVVKQGFTDNNLALTAIMEKRADGWFWAEYDAEGEPFYSGRPDVCINCHDNRKGYSDWIYAFELPR